MFASIFSPIFRAVAPAVLFLLALQSVSATPPPSPWASAVASYHAIDPDSGFNTPQRTLGKPVGGSVYAPDNSSIHSIGRPGPEPGSYLLLQFEAPIEDHPDNPMGLDFIVFGNSFWTGGNPNRKWAEPGLVEISEDVNGNGLPDDPWYVMPGSRGLNRSVLPQGIANPSPPLAGAVLNPNTDGSEYDWGYADLTPTIQEYLDNFVRPDNPFETGLTEGSGGGDAFDIAWAVPADATGNPAGLARFHFLRISAFVNASEGPFGRITPDINAAAAVARDVDSDGDGILDDYELRVAGTDPYRSESTVLALEIPPEYGGSPAGASLGEARDSQGNAIALFSKGSRSGPRAYNCMVDIVDEADPAPHLAIPGMIKSGALRRFDSSELDFEAAQLQDAQLTIAYAGAEIVGLDEVGLQPFRFTGTDFTQEGISSVIKDAAANQISFRSRQPGLFLLASTPGAGDIDGGGGAIVLHADPPQGFVGDPGVQALVYSDPIALPDAGLVPDTALFTVSATLGAIVSSDEDPLHPGIQISPSEGVIAFTFAGGAASGISLITVVSLDGAIHGQLAFVLSPGAAVGPVELYVLNSQPAAPGPIAILTGPIQDAFGNLLGVNNFVTAVAEGGRILTPDSRPDLPGHQLRLTNGAAAFTVRVDVDSKYDTAALSVYLYADTAETELIGSVFQLLEVAQMPLHGVTLLVALLAFCAAAMMRGARSLAGRTR